MAKQEWQNQPHVARTFVMASKHGPPLDPSPRKPSLACDATRAHGYSLVLHPVDVPHHALHLHRRLSHARRPHLQPTRRRAQRTSAPSTFDTATRGIVCRTYLLDCYHGALHAANGAAHSQVRLVAAVWPFCMCALRTEVLTGAWHAVLVLPPCGSSCNPSHCTLVDGRGVRPATLNSSTPRG